MRKQFFWPALAVCFTLTGCTGLPAAREMGDMALLRTLGVDAAPAGAAVTGSTGPRAKGLQAEEEPALILAADQSSLSGACLAMQGQSDSYVFFGYVDQLLIGEELADQGIQHVLNYFARDVELGLGAQMWLVRGATAREAVRSGGEEGVDSRLETLQTDSKMGVAAISRTAGEVCTDLLEQSAAYVPALALAEEAGVLTEGGYAIIKDGVLLGFLEGEEASGLELLASGPSSHILETELPRGSTAVKTTSSHTHSVLEFQGNTPAALKINCRIEARLAEYDQRPNSEELETLKSDLERQERTRLEKALSRLQAWQADCTGLGAKAGMTRPAQWQAVQEDWPDWFAQIPVEIQVHVSIQNE